MPLCGQCFKEYNGAGICPFCRFDAEEQRRQFPVSLIPGSILGGHYAVGRVLGQGGFAITYLAFDRRTNTQVAIKEYYPVEFASRGADGITVYAFSGDRAEYFTRGKLQFLEEARTLASVSDVANIVSIFNCFMENGTAYFTMEYIEGRPLDVYLRDLGRPLTAGEAKTLFLPLMAALEYVHGKGIVHRDIAPDNIIVTPSGTPKLIDFGAARYSTGEMTRTLDVILKRGFAPYEQYMQRSRQGPWTDVYALAATFYFAVTGSIPPDAPARIDSDTLAKPGAFGARLDAVTEAALLKALSMHPQDRFQTMGAFAASLQAASSVGAGEAARQTVAHTEMSSPDKREQAGCREQKKAARRERRKRNSVFLWLCVVLALFLLQNGLRKLYGIMATDAAAPVTAPVPSSEITVQPPDLSRGPYGVPVWNSVVDVDLSALFESYTRSALLTYMENYGLLEDQTQEIHSENGSRITYGRYEDWNFLDNGQYVVNSTVYFPETGIHSNEVRVLDPLTGETRGYSKLNAEEPEAVSTPFYPNAYALPFSPSIEHYEFLSRDVSGGHFVITFRILKDYEIPESETRNHEGCMVEIDPDTGLILRYIYREHLVRTEEYTAQLADGKSVTLSKMEIVTESKVEMVYNDPDRKPDYSLFS